ncbi:hypothetical protein E1B28_005770 [Marasmius oreades]|uniref:Uncharacterized protein n=1 Tax=Marasmius oreades TaxID=181124 RepID=A0A9P7UV57_9AGAR|nr:uncharacterized protein E1B28_005770 [Marasmius oreades]KAG7094970.1 hypothetical protein E1B28_005770 [Marasmius oreades]
MPSTAQNVTLSVKTNLGRYSPFSKRGSGFGNLGAENGNWRRSRGDSSSDASSSPPSSPSSPTKVALPCTSSNGPHRSTASAHKHSALAVYTINDLLLLQQSPLARMSPETRGAMKENVPEIVLSRKQRHNLKRGNGQGHRAVAAQQQQQHVPNTQPPALEQSLLAMIPSVSPRTLIVPTAPLQRQQSRLRMKRRASKTIVDELSWRRVQRPRTNILAATIVAQ